MKEALNAKHPVKTEQKKGVFSRLRNISENKKKIGRIWV